MLVSTAFEFVSRVCPFPFLKVGKLSSLDRIINESFMAVKWGEIVLFEYT